VRALRLEAGGGVGVGLAAVQAVAVAGACAGPFEQAREVTAPLGFKRQQAPTLDEHVHALAAGGPDSEMDTARHHLGSYGKPTFA
jgi:hypothetical protein